MDRVSLKLINPVQAAPLLAAMTAERDLLLSEVDRLRSTPPEQREDLHCVVSDLASQGAQLRAEVERLQSALDDARAGEGVAQMAVQRQPLTDEQIWIAVECGRVSGIGFPSKAIAVDRAIERAHGINAAAATTPSAPRAPADQQ